jgi:mRNA interferase MazF
MKTHRGDVVLVLFPNSNLRTAKRRPALVLQRDDLGSGLSQTIVAMISSNLARRGHPSRLFIRAASPEGTDAGLRLDSVLMTDNLATVLEDEINAVLGHIGEMTAIDAALRHTIGLD